MTQQSLDCVAVGVGMSMSYVDSAYVTVAYSAVLCLAVLVHQHQVMQLKGSTRQLRIRKYVIPLVVSAESMTMLLWQNSAF